MTMIFFISFMLILCAAAVTLQLCPMLSPVLYFVKFFVAVTLKCLILSSFIVLWYQAHSLLPIVMIISAITTEFICMGVALMMQRDIRQLRLIPCILGMSLIIIASGTDPSDGCYCHLCGAWLLPLLMVLVIADGCIVSGQRIYALVNSVWRGDERVL